MQPFGGKIVVAYLNVIYSNPLEECSKTRKILTRYFQGPGLESDTS
jgi:hypothetical protein